MINKISKNDWQYLLPIFILVFIFIGTDITIFWNKLDFAYHHRLIFIEPYRAVTSHFFHADVNHLLANIFGIVVARYFLIELKVKCDKLFLLLISCLLPCQTMLQWCFESVFIRSLNNFSLGFSGILYGINSFILCSSVFGKEKYLGIYLNISRNKNVRTSISFLTLLGLVWSFIPGISMIAHISGLIAGSIIFLL